MLSLNKPSYNGYAFKIQLSEFFLPVMAFVLTARSVHLHYKVSAFLQERRDYLKIEIQNNNYYKK